MGLGFYVCIVYGLFKRTILNYNALVNTQELLSFMVIKFVSSEKNGFENQICLKRTYCFLLSLSFLEGEGMVVQGNALTDDFQLSHQ